MVRDGMKSAGTLEQSEIVCDEATREKRRTEASRPFAAGHQEADVRGKAADVRRKCKQEKEMVHAVGQAAERRRARLDSLL